MLYECEVFLFSSRTQSILDVFSLIKPQSLADNGMFMNSDSMTFQLSTMCASIMDCFVYWGAPNDFVMFVHLLNPSLSHRCEPKLETRCVGPVQYRRLVDELEAKCIGSQPFVNCLPSALYIFTSVNLCVPINLQLRRTFPSSSTVYLITHTGHLKLCTSLEIHLCLAKYVGEGGKSVKYAITHI